MGWGKGAPLCLQCEMRSATRTVMSTPKRNPSKHQPHAKENGAKPGVGKAANRSPAQVSAAWATLALHEDVDAENADAADEADSEPHVQAAEAARAKPPQNHGHDPAGEASIARRLGEGGPKSFASHLRSRRAWGLLGAMITTD